MNMILNAQGLRKISYENGYLNYYDFCELLVYFR